MLKRSPNLPEVPTIAESGVPGYEMSTWHTVSGPRGLSAAVTARLANELISAIGTPAIRERFVTPGTEPVGSSSEQLREQINREYPRWEKLLSELGLRQS